MCFLCAFFVVRTNLKPQATYIVGFSLRKSKLILGLLETSVCGVGGTRSVVVYRDVSGHSLLRKRASSRAGKTLSAEFPKSSTTLNLRTHAEGGSSLSRIVSPSLGDVCEFGCIHVYQILLATQGWDMVNRSTMCFRRMFDELR